MLAKPSNKSDHSVEKIDDSVEKLESRLEA